MAMAKSVGKGVAKDRLRRDGDKQRAWRERIADQQRGGESVRVFCRENRLTEASFYRWRKEIRLRDRKTTVRVPSGSTREQLATVFSILEPTRC